MIVLMTQIAAATPSRASAGRLLPIILTGQFMAILDVSIVNVAAPTLRADLNASGPALQMVIAGYIIAYSMLLITGARLGELLGSRRMFLVGLSVFTAASLVCGLAASAELLIAFRLVQGAGAAFMVPQVLSLIQRNFAGEARARALSVYATVIAGAFVVGQVLGGVLTAAHGWRPVFLVNVPIGIALLIGGAAALPRDESGRARRLDLPGLVVLSAAVLLFVVPLVLGHERNWPLWTWLSLALSAAFFAGFVVVERRAPDPLFPATVLGAEGMRPAMGTIFGVMVAYGGFLFATALFVQGALDRGPLAAGLTFTPAAIGFGLASMNWRRVPARWHRPMIPVACVAVAAGFMALGPMGDGGVRMQIALIVIAVGMGLAFSPVMALGLGSVEPRNAADASGLLATVLQLAQVIGVAAFGSLFLSSGSLSATGTGLAVMALVAAACSVPLVRQPGNGR